MNIRTSQRAQQVQESATLTLNARAKELQTQGKKIISLSVGEPDFDTPEHIKEAAILAIHEGKTKYTAADGIPSLKIAIQSKFKNENQLDYSLKQVVVTSGAKMAIYALCHALLNPGDEVIIPAPYWVSYPDIVKLADGKPVFLHTSIENHYKITPEQLEKAITPKTRLFFINSPSNPSGITYSHMELKALGDVILKHPHVMVMSDDIYEHILWNHTPFKNILNMCPELYDRTIVINGVSKSYSMTGWRIGYAAGPAPLIAEIKKIQSQSTSNPTSISQAAAEAALVGDQQYVKDMNHHFKLRHDYLIKALQEIRGFKVLPSDGTFYSFPNVSELIKQTPHINTDVDLSEYLLENAEVAVVPGTAFGSPGSLRLSYAVHIDTLKDAIKRIKKAIDLL